MPNTSPITLRPGSTVIHSTKPACVVPYLYVQADVIRRTSEIPAGDVQYVVEFRWTDTRERLDRPVTHGISTGVDRSLAMRLATACAADAKRLHPSPEIRRDVDGNSYVSSSCAVMGRYLNADLRKLGW